MDLSNYSTAVNRGDLFAMTYGAEVVIRLKANFPKLRMSSFTSDSNDELLGKNLDLIDKRREKAMVQLAYYHQKLKQGYDANVKLRPLAPGDLECVWEACFSLPKRVCVSGIFFFF